MVDEILHRKLVWAPLVAPVMSYTTSGTRYVFPVKNPVISHEWGKDEVVIAYFW